MLEHNEINTGQQKWILVSTYEHCLRRRCCTPCSMSPKPDYGYDTYKGNNRLLDKVGKYLLTTGHDATGCRAPRA